MKTDQVMSLLDSILNSRPFGDQRGNGATSIPRAAGSTSEPRRCPVSGGAFRCAWVPVLAGCAVLGTALAEVEVTTIFDENNGSLNPALGTGTSLREAVVHSPAGSTIVFAPGVHGLTFTLTSGQLLITKNLVIDATAAPTGIRVSGNSSSRVFDIQSGKTVSITALKILDGDISGDGGGIRNAGTLSLANCELESNEASGGGGAIRNSGTLSLTACTLVGNTAGVGGGAIEHASGVLTLTNCTLNANSAQWGGGIDGDGTSTIRLHSCTVSGNQANDKGGGIEETTGTLVLENSIVAGNTATNSGPDLKATSINSQLGVNLISSTNGLGGGFSGIVAAPMLGALGNNGGPTRTMLPLTGSPAINAGGTTALLVDQRGRPRVVGPAVDIGAVEVQPTLVVTNDDDAGPGSLRDTVAIAPPAALVTFAPSLDHATILLTGGPVVISKDVVIDASARTGLAVSAGATSRLFTVNAGTEAGIIGLQLRDGAATTGGAIHNAGTLNLERCRVAGCFADEGGGVANAAGAVANLSGCELIDNASYYGGAIHNEGTVHLSNVVALGSFSEEEGGAVWNSGALVAEDSVLNRSSSYFFGGAIYSTGSLSMARCTVADNWASDSGGGIYGSGTLDACTISGNSCIGAGGGLSGTYTLTNCTVADNDAVFEGGGIAHFSGVSHIVSCTIAGNHADLEGGGIYTTLPGQLNLTNSIVADNSSSDAPDFSGEIGTEGGVNLISDTGGLSGGFAGIVADPQLAPLANNGGPTLTLQPQAGSPAINAGGATALATDQRGLARLVGAKVDIGSVETGNAIPTVVVNTAADENDGIAVGNISLRDAMTDAVPGSIITFAPALSGQMIALSNGPLVFGKNLTVDAGPLAGGVIVTGSAVPGFDIGAGRRAALKGVTIAGFEFTSIPDGDGAAIRNLAGHAEIHDCTLRDNVGLDGGAVFNAGVLEMTGCTITGNESIDDGGGLFNAGLAWLTRCVIAGNGSFANAAGIDNGRELYLSECTLASNSANLEGGGLYNRALAHAYIDRCTVSGNRSEGGLGGGISNLGDVRITNSTFTANQADDGFAGAIFNAGELEVVSCTVAGNHADERGGGILSSGSGELTLDNSIVAANTSGSGDAPDVEGAITQQLGVNLLGSTDGVTVPFTGIVADPMLNPLADNGGPTLTMLPKPGSPAIDAGGTTSLAVDQRGFPRVQGGTVDIGAVETAAVTPGLVVNTTADENNGPAVGNVSLREAIAGSPPGSVVTFAPALDGQVIILTVGTLVVGQDLVIDASALPGGISVSGDASRRVFEIPAGKTVSMANLAIINGRTSGDGGGILNAGHLTLTGCEVAANRASDDGAGIYSSGPLVLEATNVSGNVASDSGGGIVSQSSLALAACALSGNTADNGGAIYNDGGVVTIEDSTLSNNTADDTPGGGAIDNDGGEVTLIRSTLSGNTSASGGGAIENDGPLTILASTLSDNTTAVGGGAIEHTAGVLTLTSSTLAGNTAKWGGAIDGDGTSTIRLNCCTVSTNHASDKGGGIEETTGTLVLENSLVGGNSAVNSGPDLKATSINQQLGVNLLSNTEGLGGSFSGIVGNPGLSVLANWGGPTQTMVPQTASPAIDAGGPTALSVDQRGFPRMDGRWIDIGAVEVQNYLLVTTAADSGAGSLRRIIELARPGSLIPFSPAALSGQTIHLTSGPLVIAKNLDIDASSLPRKVTVTGSVARAFDVAAGIQVTIKAVDVSGFDSSDDNGPALRNAGQLALTDCTFAGNIGAAGGAVHNAAAGQLTMTGCVFHDNEGASGGGGLWNSGMAELTGCVFAGNGTGSNGAGISNDGSLVLTDCAISDNWANTVGGGLENVGTATISRCTFSHNVSEAGFGGGIANEGTLAMINSTLAGNLARLDGVGGGIGNSGGLTLSFCTLSENEAYSGGGIFNGVAGTLVLANSIIAGNRVASTAPDLEGAIHTQVGVNLLGSTDGVTTAFTGIVADPMLDRLGVHGGPTLTMPPLAGSPAINAAGATPLTIDQRGFSRVVGGTADIGAVETGNAIPIVVVNTHVDENNGIGVGNVSLREAMASAAPGSILAFAPALDGQTITLTVDQLVANRNLIIDATPLAGGITVTGEVLRAFKLAPGRGLALFGVEVSGMLWDETTGVFDTDTGGAILNPRGYLEMAGCTVSGNTVLGDGTLYNSGHLTMSACSLLDNEAFAGGALHNSGTGSAEVIGCAISHNGAYQQGAGIFNRGILTLTESVVSGNSANSTGGGLENLNQATIDRCSFFHNRSEGGFGGGIANSGTLVMTNSTVSENTVWDGGGGGIGNWDAGVLHLVSCTVADNSSDTGDGGGIYMADGALHLTNSLIAGNFAFGAGPDLNGSIASETGVNLLGSLSGVTGPFAGIEADPLLGPLGDNGGPTLTHLPQAGSPAINAGGATTLTVDQRGFPRVVGGTVDIGSVETGNPVPP